MPSTNRFFKRFLPSLLDTVSLLKDACGPIALCIVLATQNDFDEKRQERNDRSPLTNTPIVEPELHTFFECRSSFGRAVVSIDGNNTEGPSLNIYDSRSFNVYEGENTATAEAYQSIAERFCNTAIRPPVAEESYDEATQSYFCRAENERNVQLSGTTVMADIIVRQDRSFSRILIEQGSDFEIFEGRAEDMRKDAFNFCAPSPI